MRHENFPVVVKSSWSAIASDADKQTIQTKINDMTDQGKTDGLIDSVTWPPPNEGFRYFSNSAAAQEFIDFCTGQNFAGFAGAEILVDSGPFVDQEPAFIIDNPSLLERGQ